MTPGQDRRACGTPRSGSTRLLLLFLQTRHGAAGKRDQRYLPMPSARPAGRTVRPAPMSDLVIAPFSGDGAPRSCGPRSVCNANSRCMCSCRTGPWPRRLDDPGHRGPWSAPCCACCSAGAAAGTRTSGARRTPAAGPAEHLQVTRQYAFQQPLAVTVANRVRRVFVGDGRQSGYSSRGSRGSAGLSPWRNPDCPSGR